MSAAETPERLAEGELAPRPGLRSLVEDLHERRERIRLGGGEEKIERQHQAGKLTARERIALRRVVPGDERVAPEPGHLPTSVRDGVTDRARHGVVERERASEVRGPVHIAMSGHARERRVEPTRDERACLVENARIDHRADACGDRGVGRLPRR